MKGLFGAVASVIALTMLMAALGGWLGVRYGLQAARARPGLDEVLHHQLRLSGAQQQRLAALESNFMAQRKAREAEMRSANRDLAAAIAADPHYGPQAEKAINRFHAAMKTLQEETIIHILAMRAVLTPDQARQFDQTVSRVLNSDEP